MFCHTALASISIPKRVASSPAGELISRQNQTPTALVPGVEPHKHGLWIHSSTRPPIFPQLLPSMLDTHLNPSIPCHYGEKSVLNTLWLILGGVKSRFGDQRGAGWTDLRILPDCSSHEFMVTGRPTFSRHPEQSRALLFKMDTF